MQVIVRYKVKPERVAENQALVEAVFAEIKQTEPDGLRYAAFIANDGVTFFHVASIEAKENPLSKSKAFKAFQDGIVDRCDEPPVPVTVNDIGSYNFLTP